MLRHVDAYAYVCFLRTLRTTCSGMIVQSVIRLFVCIYLLTLLESVISTVHTAKLCYPQ